MNDRDKAELDDLRRRVARLEHWCRQFGDALRPAGGYIDTFGDGVRCCKAEVSNIISRKRAA